MLNLNFLYSELSYSKVDFKEDYDWDFIVYPGRVQFNYCSGSCSLTTFRPESTFTYILEQTLQEFGVIPRCTNQKMTPLELLGSDENGNFVQWTIPKMIVERCDCM